jgi:hypothetical protein
LLRCSYTVVSHFVGIYDLLKLKLATEGESKGAARGKQVLAGLSAGTITKPSLSLSPSRCKRVTVMVLKSYSDGVQWQGGSEGPAQVHGLACNGYGVRE